MWNIKFLLVFPNINMLECIKIVLVDFDTEEVVGLAGEDSLENVSIGYVIIS